MTGLLSNEAADFIRSSQNCIGGISPDAYAVDAKALMSGGKYHAALKNAKKSAFTHSDDDLVVGDVYPINEHGTGLGAYDVDIPGMQRINWDAELNTGMTLVDGHSDIYGHRATEAIRRVLK